MITWISRPAAAVAGLILLGACTGEASFLQGLSTGSTPPPPEVSMVRGAVTLVPPFGFCIDPSTVTQRFALMARCDVLSSDGLAAAPLAVITVSLSDVGQETALPTAEQTAAAWGLSDVSRVRRRDNSVIFRAKGPTPSAAFHASQWRGTARIGQHVMGVALYGPAKENPIGAEGGAILSDLIAATKRSE